MLIRTWDIMPQVEVGEKQEYEKVDYRISK